MNALEKFISDHPFGFIQEIEIDALIKIHRLCQVLVRCGCCRFVCAVQDLRHLTKCIKAGGDHIRDVAITVTEMETAHDWRPEPETRPHNSPSRVWAPGFPRKESKDEAERLRRYYWPQFNEADCGGVFDGFQVTSDADPGL